MTGKGEKMSKNTGGPAFPFTGFTNQWGAYVPHWEGMTLRDYFAAVAMASVWNDIPEDANRDRALEYLGRTSYEMADAMLEAREK